MYRRDPSANMVTFRMNLLLAEVFHKVYVATELWFAACAEHKCMLGIDAINIGVYNDDQHWDRRILYGNSPRINRRIYL